MDTNAKLFRYLTRASGSVYPDVSRYCPMVLVKLWSSRGPANDFPLRDVLGEARCYHSRDPSHGSTLIDLGNAWHFDPLPEPKPTTEYAAKSRDDLVEVRLWWVKSNALSC